MTEATNQLGGQALSLCMIVKNEERALSRCLDSVKGLATEVVIVDTGSTDRTVEVAASHGAKVVAFDFSIVDFAAARNYGLTLAHGQWILCLDADEILDSASVPCVQQLAARNENAGYYFQRLNYRPSAEAATTDYVVRLFPNRPAYRYRGRVHETIDASILAGGGRLVPTSLRIHHDFASDSALRRRRNLWYIRILQEEIAADPKDYTRLDFLAAEYHQLGMLDQAAEIAECIARVRPLDAVSHLHAGVYHLLYKFDREKARSYFMEALRLRPEYAEAQSFLQLAERPATAGKSQSRGCGMNSRRD
jgi:glycosyltransferase involved in cell wall biosynthesis